MNVGDLFKIMAVAGFDGPLPKNQIIEMQGIILREWTEGLVLSGDVLENERS